MNNENEVPILGLYNTPSSGTHNCIFEMVRVETRYPHYELYKTMFLLIQLMQHIRILSSLSYNRMIKKMDFPIIDVIVKNVCVPKNVLLVLKLLDRAITLTIDFSINGLCTENRLRSQFTPNTVQNKIELINLVIRIELTRSILMPRFSNFLGNSIINFPIFLYVETYFLRVAVSLLCRLQAVSKTLVPIYPYLISEGIRNCSTL